MRNRWRIWCLAIAAVPILLSVLAPREWITGAYSRGVFPVWQRAVVPVTGAVGLPITGILIVLAAGLLVWLAVRGYRRGRREGTPAWPLVRRGAGNAAVGTVVLYAVFLCTWGFGYRQVPVEERWGIASQVPGENDAMALGLACVRLLDDPPPDEARDPTRALESIRRSLADLVERQDGWRPAVPAQLKLLPPGTLMTFSVTGIASPFLLEPNVDAGLPEVDRLGVGAHELAHSVGYCGEADADLAGLTAAISADDAYARYAGALRLLKLMFVELEPVECRVLAHMLPARAYEDLTGQQRAVESFRSETLTKASNTVYDGYLRSQGVTAGRGDYDRAADLLIRAWKAEVLSLN